MEKGVRFLKVYTGWEWGIRVMKKGLGNIVVYEKEVGLPTV